jgi:hypothetical protein
VRKIPSAVRSVFCVVFLLALSGLSAYSQQKEKIEEHHNGIVHDWTTRHVVVPSFGPIHSMIALQNEPRAIQSWQETIRGNWNRWNRFYPRRPVRSPVTFKRDWAILLGSGGAGMAPSMYPAKFGFDPTATPTCIITGLVPIPDYVVYTVNAAASATQPNIVAFQDLYSGTGGGLTGICDSQRPTYFTGDTVTSAATFWSYAITAADGVVSTSPALSLDGTKVAFVEKGGGGTAHFHVLAYNGGTTSTAGDGVTLSNSQTVTNPMVITSGFVSSAPIAGSGTVTDLPMTASGTASDTLSSPFVDYTNDLAYVGNDGGTLFRFKNVFCTTAVCGGAAPSLDTAWGGTGSISVCGGTLTGPTEDPPTGNVFVGCSDGKLYAFNSSGTALAGSPMTVGDGSATGGIVDPPLIDVVNDLLYTEAGATPGGTEVVMQTGTTNATFNVSPVSATLGSGGHFSMHAPAFNNAYLGGSGTPLLYEWGLNSADTEIELWGIGFTSFPTMSSGTPPAGLAVGGSSPVELSPVTEFFNANTTTDWLFASGQTALSPNFLEANITAGFPAGFSGSADEGNGTTGIIVDDDSLSNQASSIYVGTFGANASGVKLTQSGLN